MAKKCIICIFLVCFYMISLCTCFATALDGIGLNPTPTAPDGGDTIAGKILGFLQWAGYAIAVGIVIYIGIKYIMASADEKASLKSTVIKFFIGAFLIVNATTILNIFFD